MPGTAPEVRIRAPTFVLSLLVGEPSPKKGVKGHYWADLADIILSRYMLCPAYLSVSFPRSIWVLKGKRGLPLDFSKFPRKWPALLSRLGCRAQEPGVQPHGGAARTLLQSSQTKPLFINILVLEEPTKTWGGQQKPGFAPATRRKPGFRLKNLVLLLQTRTKTVQHPYKSSTKPVFSVCFLKSRFLL